MQYCRADAVAMLEYSNRVLILLVCGSLRSVKVKCLLISERYHAVAILRFEKQKVAKVVKSSVKTHSFYSFY